MSMFNAVYRKLDFILLGMFTPEFMLQEWRGELPKVEIPYHTKGVFLVTLPDALKID